MAMQSAAYWIDQLHLQAHPEGGFYKETYRSGETIPQSGLPARFAGPRSSSTAIYFLLRSQDCSLFHRIKSDELWHWHAGSTVSIFVLEAQGLSVHHLGDDPRKGDVFQCTIPARAWFGANVEQKSSYSLVSCTVAPGFEFEDFELGDREKLRKEFPGYKEIIDRLTR